MSSRGKSLNIEGTPCRREMVWSAKPMIYDIDMIFKWLINKNEKRVEKGRPWRHGMVWAEHPGRRPRAVIPIKLWLVSQTPETALAFFLFFINFLWLFLLDATKNSGLWARPQRLHSLFCFFLEFSRKFIDTKNCCLFDRCVSALVFYFHFLSPSDKKRWLLRSDFTFFS